jgi:hypothetical protein
MDVDPVGRDHAALRPQQTEEQMRQSGFAGAGRPDQGGRRSDGQDEIDVRHGGQSAAGIGETDISQTHGVAKRRRRLPGRRRRDDRRVDQRTFGTLQFPGQALGGAAVERDVVQLVHTAVEHAEKADAGECEPGQQRQGAREVGATRAQDEQRHDHAKHEDDLVDDVRQEVHQPRLALRGADSMEQLAEPRLEIRFTSE